MSSPSRPVAFHSPTISSRRGSTVLLRLPCLHRLLLGGLLLFPIAGRVPAAEPPPSRRSVVLENESARLVVDLAGGSLGEFRLQGSDLNPLQWGTPRPGETGIRGFGHFLCLDRWGPASAAEAAKGMPYHGEAAHVEWSVVRGAAPREGALEAQLAARLPLAGFSIRRTLRLSAQGAACAVREEITNENPLGRIYNAVQHPTIGPDRKSTRLNSSHGGISRMPSSA